jgi:diguanylate cyclase (GGDEF)-like protein
MFRPDRQAGKRLDTRLFIALLNPGIALVLASAFLALWLHQRHRLYLAVMALAYCASAIGFLLQYFNLPFGHDPTRVLSNLCFTLAASCLACAVVARYGRRVPYLAIGFLAAGGLAAFFWFLFVHPHLTWRIYSINFAFGGICLVVAAELRTVRGNGPTEKILFVLSLASALNFFLRTLVVLEMSGPLVSQADLYDSIYWNTALLSHAVLSLLIALSLFTAAALDVLTSLKSESHTDPLSGLLNRRGFEERATAMLKRAQESGAPAALVLADLDHFKAVNDVFGHAVGDRVIVAFAAALRSTAGKSGIVGRLGGEEFAVLLPVSDLGAARLFAESVRTAFPRNTPGDLPVKARVTASFGVAAGDDSLTALLSQADNALYQAKRSGRDSVRISYRRPRHAPASTCAA